MLSLQVVSIAVFCKAAFKGRTHLYSDCTTQHAEYKNLETNKVCSPPMWAEMKKWELFALL